MNKSVAYLCLQTTREGQASYAHVHEIIQGLRRRRWLVTLYEPDHLPVSKKASVIKRALSFIKPQYRLVIRLRKYEAIYIRGHFAAFPVSMLAKLLRIPVIQEINGPYEDLFIAWPFTRRMAKLFIGMSRIQMAWADMIITVTKLLAEWCKNEARHERIFVVPNAANTYRFNPYAKTSLSLPSKYVVFFGSLAKWQGIELLIEAVNHKNWPPNVSLIIAGNGDMKLQVEQAASVNPLICYLGIIPQEELAGVIAGSVASMITKNNLGKRDKTGLSPLKMYESLAAGVPVIVTDFPGIADLVKEYGCGIIVQLGDIAAIANAVAMLENNHHVAQEMGAKGRDAVINAHSWDQRAAETDLIIESLLQLR